MGHTGRARKLCEKLTSRTALALQGKGLIRARSAERGLRPKKPVALRRSPANPAGPSLPLGEQHGLPDFPPLTPARGMIKPSSCPPLCRTVPGADPPTITQSCLDPLDTHGVLGSQQFDDSLCGEFRVTFPYFTDANAGYGPAIDGPTRLRLRPAMSGRGFPTALDDGPRSHDTHRVVRAQFRDEFLRGATRMLLPQDTGARFQHGGGHVGRTIA
jgi:hypothetical protein